LTPIYGFEILALGTTVSMLINSGIQTCFLHKDLDLPWNHFLNLRLLKIITSAVMTFVFCFELDKLMPEAVGLFESIFYLGVKLTSTVLCYGVLAFLFGERSVVLSFLSKIKNRL
jgi:putative peptidoglycan lipid II flippase